MKRVVNVKQAFRFRRQGLFTRWMSSYAFILAIPLIISTIIYFQSGNIIRNEINRANMALLKQVQQAMDSRVLEIERFSLQVSQHPKFKGIMNARELNNHNRTAIMQLLNDFGLYRTANSFIDDFYIYLSDLDIVLSTTAMFNNSQLFYTLSGGLGELSYPEWIELMNRKQFGDYMVFERQEQGEERRKVITVANSLPLESPYTVSAKIMIVLDEELFQQEVERVQWVNQGTLFIIDENDQLLATTSGSVPPLISAAELTDPENIATKEINGEKVTISYVSSEVNSWKYVSVLPSSIFLEKARYIRNITLISLAACLIGGIIIAYYFTRKNYNPVHELIEIVSQKSKVSFEQSKNEYEFIKRVIAHTFNEKEEINRKLEQQSSAMKANFLERLLKGRLERSFPVDEALATYNMTFHSDKFAVVLFYIEDYNELFRDSSLQDLEEKLKFVHLIIKNIVEELVNQQHNGFVEEVDGMMACLVNFKEDAPQLQAIISAILEETRRYVQDRFHIQFTASVSRVHSEIVGISAAYQEALEAIEYKIVMGASQIIFYEDVAVQPEEYTYYYPIEHEQQLINLIKAGQWEQARDALQEIFDRNFAGGPVPIDLAKCLMFAMIGTMLKTLEDISLSEEAFMDELQPVARLFACETIPAMKIVMLDILQQICRYMEVNKKSHNTHLRDQVAAYLLEHYHDVNLGIASIAEQFDVHPTYLSRFFKEQTGETLSDAINKIRLSRAKQLLAEDWSIGDTAVKVGFYNSNAFIRTFKKYEGITPGQYKSTL